MTFGLVLGWLGALTAAAAGLPQAARLIRSRDYSGVSAAAWTLTLGSALGWASHGVQLGLVNQIVPNLTASVAAFAVLYRLHRISGLSLSGRVAPGLAIGAAMACVDHFWGAVAFGVLGAVPGATAITAQGVQLVRSVQVTGVPVLGLLLGATNSAVWIVWGIHVAEPGTAIASCIGGALALFNLVWRLLRGRGLRPFFASAHGPALRRAAQAGSARRAGPPHRREQVRPRRVAPPGRHRIRARAD
ncbi:MAG: hypothetical protein LBK95_04105 [Bifidobacteriaceae bacterium]|jgi:uncharacterized protein with PQ loop repeat|nr:hypothetical protein [Bifidobacteriaceae bacterium]